MINLLQPDEKPKGPAAPPRRPSPKRGAFPTPKEEIDKATPYVPRTDEAPTRVDKKKER